jgi:zinc protease
MSGLKAWVSNNTSAPLIAIDLSFKHSGYAYDNDGYDGLADMVSRCLLSGTQNMDKVALERYMGSNSIFIDGSAERDIFQINIITTPSNIDKALSLLTDILTKPSMPDNEIKLSNDKRLAAIKLIREQPVSLAELEWNKVFFKDHPYSKLGLGDEETTAKVTKRENLLKFMQDNFTSDNVIVSMAGKVDVAHVKGLIASLLRSLPKTGHAQKLPAIRGEGGGTTLVTKDVAQEVFIFGLPSLPPKHKDYYTALMVNAILGKFGFSSYLFQEARLKQGLVYSVSTNVEVYEGATYIVGWATTSPQNVQHLTQVIKEQMQRLKQEPVASKVLADIKSYMIGRYAITMDNLADVAELLSQAQLRGYSTDFIEQRSAAINKTTSQDVQRVASEIFREDKLLLLVLGSGL